MRARTIAMLCAPALLLAACGDDDDGGDSAAAYCDLSSELDQAAGAPSSDQLDDLIDAAPDEISADVQTLVDTIESGEYDEDVAKAEANISAFEEENCGGDLAGSEEAPDDTAAPAVVTFLSPANGDTVSNPVTIEPNVVRAEIAPADESGEGQGHYHVMVDTECLATGDTIPSDDSHIHFGDGSTTLELPELEPGEHTLCLQLGDGEHRAFGAASTITVDVES